LTSAGKRDVIFLLADGGMEQVIRGFLGRDQCHRSLNCGPFEFDPALDISVAPAGRRRLAFVHLARAALATRCWAGPSR
jgi:hypothetical protein